MTEPQSPPVLIHVPHASTFIPPEVRAAFALNDEQLHQELLRMTDRYTDELFNVPNSLGAKIVYPVSRLVVDPERFESDEDEPMAAKGLGVIYRKTSTGDILRERLTQEERDSLLNKYYRPHHDQLLSAVQRILDGAGRCLIIDAHSFPHEPLRYEEPDPRPRPDICIGTDQFHTPEWLRQMFVEKYKEAGFDVAVNRPFSGSITPASIYQQEQRVYSIMVELNRRLYMDERTGEWLEDDGEFLQTHQELLSSLIEAIVLRWA